MDVVRWSGNVIASTGSRSGNTHLTNFPTIGNAYLMTTRVSSRHKSADSKGRVSLGAHFANRVVIVEHRSADEVVVRLARVIPEGEAWLYENPQALASLRRGLDQARKGKVTKKPPDLKAAAKLAEQLED
jgi:hypothetical protein